MRVRETASCLALLAGALAATATAATADGNAPMAVTVAPRSESSVFSDTTLVYLDGLIDADAPARLSKALDAVDGKITIWLNLARRQPVCRHAAGPRHPEARCIDPYHQLAHAAPRRMLQRVLARVPRRRVSLQRQRRPLRSASGIV